MPPSNLTAEVIEIEYTGLVNPDDPVNPHGETMDEVLGLRWVLWSNNTPYNARPNQRIPHETKRRRAWPATPENLALLAPFNRLPGFKVHHR